MISATAKFPQQQLSPNQISIPRPSPKHLPSLVPGSNNSISLGPHFNIPGSHVGVREKYLKDMFSRAKNRTSATLSESLIKSIRSGTGRV